MAQEPLIQLEAVTKNYPMGEVIVYALRGLNLRIASGEFIALLGPSGCGKTTTLNLIGGLDTPTAGQVIVEGEDIATYNEDRLTEYRRRKLGFVFQFFNLIPTLSAAENVEFALALTNAHALHAQALDLLGLVGLRDRADHFPSQLSGGEQQRVAIARSLSNNPRLLLCDEPTGNLDADTGQQVLRAIRELNRKKGTTVVFVTHNSAITLIADRIVRLRNGAVDHIETNVHPLDVAELVW